MPLKVVRTKNLEVIGRLQGCSELLGHAQFLNTRALLDNLVRLSSCKIFCCAYAHQVGMSHACSYNLAPRDTLLDCSEGDQITAVENKVLSPIVYTSSDSRSIISDHVQQFVRTSNV